MKSWLLSLMLLSSSLSFAQSMIVLKTGKVLTVDDQGQLFDLGNFVLPYKIKALSGRYLVEDNRDLRTVDRNGLMYSKEEESKAPLKIVAFGENYLISRSGRIITFDDQGFMYRSDERIREFKKVMVKGGSFFVTKKKIDGEKVSVFNVVTNQGLVKEVNIPNVNPGKISSYGTGGNYFTTPQGELFTVSSDGYVYSKKDFGLFFSSLLRKGGNYFFARGNLYTVAQSGILENVARSSSIGAVKYYGTNFFITAKGVLYTVSAAGELKSLPFSENLSKISHFSQL